MIEININDEKWLNDKINYSLFNEKKEQLNISSICENDNIFINYKIKNDSLLNLSKISSFDNLGVNVFNSKDPFFNDICFPYSENGADMVLRDRLTYIYQNYTICEEGCTYEKTDIIQKSFICNCSISGKSSDININNFNSTKINFKLLSNSTFGVIKCYKLVFSLKIDIKNIGFWIHLITILFHIGIYILHCKIGIVPMQKYIKNEMEKYHYLITDDENNKKDDNENINKSMDNSENNKNDENNKNNEDNKNNEEKNIDESNKKKDKLKNEKDKNIDESIKSDKNTKEINIIYNNTFNELKIKRNKTKVEVKNNRNIDSLKKIKTTMIKSLKDSTSQNEFIIDRLNTFKRQETIDINEKIDELINNPELVEYYKLIKIDANNESNNKKPQESKYILTNYDYDLALQYEKRSFWRICFIILLSKDDFLNTFFFKSPLHIIYLRVCLLIFSFSSDAGLNTLFYFNDKISDQFHYIGNHQFWHSIYKNLLFTILCTILTKIMGFFLLFLTQSISSIEEEFKKEEKKMRENKNYFVNNERKLEIQRKINKILKILKIKIAIFFIIDLLLMIFFLYYQSAFSAVFKYTQINIIKDTVSSFILALPTSFATSLILCILYKISLKFKIKLLYKSILFLV